MSLAVVFSALTALTCALMLLHRYRSTKSSLLLWGGLCFLALAGENLIVVIDRSQGPAVNLQLWRALTGFIGFAILLFGLIGAAGQEG